MEYVLRKLILFVCRRLQCAILCRGCEFLRKGGRLVYSMRRWMQEKSFLSDKSVVNAAEDDHLTL
jgi:hypothetical protein